MEILNIIILGVVLNTVFSIAHLLVTVQQEGELRLDQIFKLILLLIVGMIPFILVVAHIFALTWFLAAWVRENFKKWEGKVLWKRKKP